MPPTDDRRDLRLYRQIKKLLNDGAAEETVTVRIQEYAAKVRAAGKDHAADLRRTATLFRDASRQTQERVYPALLEGAQGRASEKLAVRSRRLGLDLREIPSFTVSMNHRMYQKRVSGGPLLPEMRLAASKAEGHRFAEHHGVRIPQRVAGPLSGRELPLRAGTVVKPADAEGARGVFLVFSEDMAREVKTGESLHSLEAVRSAMEQALARGTVRRDEWVLEELITEDPEGTVVGRDVKFYCFYGVCPLILEVVRWPELGYRWWTAEGERAETGKYPELDFEGQGFSQDLYEEACRLSREIPAPFIRIDFINSDSTPALGEFESHPGDYERFDDHWDSLLGCAYLDAESRLIRDMLRGRTFPFFAGS